MKGAYHIVLFFATLYDYFWATPAKEETTPDDGETLRSRFKSMPTHNNTPLLEDSYDAQEDGDETGYSILREEQAPEEGRTARLMRGAQEVASRFTRRKVELDKEAAGGSEALNAVGNYVATKTGTLASGVTRFWYRRQAERVL